MLEEISEVEQAAHNALCQKIDQLIRGAVVTYDQALHALVAVTAQLCTEGDNEAALCLTICENLLAEFRYRMEQVPPETIIPIPET